MAHGDSNEQYDLMALEEEWATFGELDMSLLDKIYISSSKLFKPESPANYQDLRIGFEEPDDALVSNELLNFFNQPSSIEYRKISAFTYTIFPPREIPINNFYEAPEDSIAITNRLQKDARSILGSPLLYSLNADIMNPYPTDPAPMRILFEILRSNPPNLRELQVTVYPGGVFNDGIEAFPFLSSEFNTALENMTSIRFPPLEKLVVEGYDFEESPDGGRGWYRNIEKPEADWRTRLKFPWNILPMWYINRMGKSHFIYRDTIRDIPLERLPSLDGVSNLDIWLKVMDWSKLKTLHMIQPSPVAMQELGIVGGLTGLKELKIDGMKNPWEYDVKSKWETIVDFLEDVASNGTSLTPLSIRDISIPKMTNCNDATTEYKAREKLLGVLLRHTSLTKLHLYDGIQFSSCGSGAQLPKQIPILVSALTLSSIEDLAIEIPSLPGFNFSNSENGSWKTDGIDPEISDEEMYKDFTPFIQQPRLKSVEFHVPAPECWRHQLKRFIRPEMYGRSGEVEIMEVERCEREEKELGKRTRRLFEWMNGERERVGEDAIRRLRIAVGRERLGGKKVMEVEMEMLGRISVGWEWRGESAVWECWIGEEEEMVECEGGRRWREDEIWGG
ncbi:hypothetical protein BCON_0302g00020 [Botryotinia convoluta]|uniref:Uncharacterized protein n=1 Tax=Botryotinia convoluta TaxID=54673 RepID=A0A4Z1HDS1_9HELO|nr:hypothetical protein BCON_0302g00020 [Botryotinia convoluta]